ncbi:DUF6082 family protein [Streptosporangium sp. NPDC087985]|uniref:DUF6082 family protein n=1 Tax=Streptosporangium sp. NPDC087985 TaxID=3366196 RepID=UPI00380A8D29
MKLGRRQETENASISIFRASGHTFRSSKGCSGSSNAASRSESRKNPRLHADLMRMAMEDPLYRACWGTFFTSENANEQRAHMYVNMIINHRLMMWELRSITEAHLWAISSIVLSGPVGWRFWTDAREDGR